MSGCRKATQSAEIQATPNETNSSPPLQVLRLQPPLIMLLRYVRNDFSVTNRAGKSYVVPKGHIVATSPSFAHRLPHIYKRVDEFDPDRFGPGREEDKVG
jgi:sterol 14-demethylase